jgi:hypothetical protein
VNILKNEQNKICSRKPDSYRPGKRSHWHGTWAFIAVFTTRMWTISSQLNPVNLLIHWRIFYYSVTLQSGPITSKWPPGILQPTFLVSPMRSTCPVHQVTTIRSSSLCCVSPSASTRAERKQSTVWSRMAIQTFTKMTLVGCELWIINTIIVGEGLQLTREALCMKHKLVEHCFNY